MAIELWDSGTLYEVLRDDRMDPIPDWFMQNYFREQFFSEDKEIRFSELPAADRKMAPFVLPTEQGKPIFSAKGETMKAFEPAYIKPKDAVRAEDARTRRPSEILRNAGQPLTLEQKFDNRVIEIVEYHQRAIRIQWARMCAQAYIDAKVTVKYGRDQGAANPEVTIDYGRDPNLNIVLNTNYWSDPDYNIIGDLTNWSNLMYGTKFGARPRRLTVGADVAPHIQRNKGILALLSTQIRGGESTTMERGMFNIDQPMSYIATIGGIGQAIEVWTYKDQVQNDDGSLIDLLHPKDVILEAPGFRGVMAFGAIYDVDAIEAGQALQIDIFPKMFKTPDPGELFIMHQSAPLPVALTPNRVLKARVLAG
jgi:hypothetical protein